MNVEAYDLDGLRSIVRDLQDENKILKKRLDDAGIPYDSRDFFDEEAELLEEYDPDQGGRILDRTITRDMANQFFSMFWGRTDVFAKRGPKGSYFPQCRNFWKDSLCKKKYGEKISCEDCPNRKWAELSPELIMSHLIGSKSDGTDVLGVYPLLPDGTCRFLVFDFDNHEKGAELSDFANPDKKWRDEVDALRRICEINGIRPLVERSRSGNGAHLWIFFRHPVPAALAREFGFTLLDKGSESVNLRSFHYYDRMYPSQDSSSSIGNLIALPLQGNALKNGNSAFVDKNWNAYPDQWYALFNYTKKLDKEDIERLLINYNNKAIDDILYSNYSEHSRPKPWEKKQAFNKADVIGKVHIVLSDGIYVDTLNLLPNIQNQIRSLAAFDNPIFYKNIRLGHSNYYNFRTVYMGHDENGYICIPRGLRERLLSLLKEAGIEYDIKDCREKGRPIRVSFTGSLRMQQDLAADTLLSYEDGILNAATAFGKTVVCSYLISQRKVSTLILLQSKDLLEQWVDELNKFLEINEEPPVYKTKTGREKRRDSVIGILHGNKDTLTGIIDVAMVGSLKGKENINEILDKYGMVIMDECHHCGSPTSVDVMQKIKSKYVYGVSATIKRGDNLERIIHLLLGPVRHSYSAKERAIEQGIGHFVYPRYTRTVLVSDTQDDINEAYAVISSNEDRNRMIIEDVQLCVRDGRTPVVLTRYKDQAKYIYDGLKDSADFVFIMYGDNSDKENSEIRNQLKDVPADKSIILVATGQKIGEGFDCPRLDTLMLAAPVSFSGRLEQYIGRLNRDYPGKKDVMVYDYVDSHIRVFDSMFSKRLRTYKSTGFILITRETPSKQTVNAIFDRGNYTEVFEQDIIEAEKQIIISSPDLTEAKVQRLISLVKERQESGCKVSVITTEADGILFGDPGYKQELMETMKNNGITVIAREDLSEHFAVIDNTIVWHGGMNLLGKEDAWDNLMRIKSSQVAAELLELSLN